MCTPRPDFSRSSPVSWPPATPVGWCESADWLDERVLARPPTPATPLHLQANGAVVERQYEAVLPQDLAAELADHDQTADNQQPVFHANELFLAGQLDRELSIPSPPVAPTPATAAMHSELADLGVSDRFYYNDASTCVGVHANDQPLVSRNRPKRVAWAAIETIVL